MSDVKSRDFAAGAAWMKEEARKVADSWSVPSNVKLAAGEMSAQELRTAQAVARGIAAAIDAIPVPAAPPTPALDREAIAREIGRAMLDNPTDGTFGQRVRRREEISREYADAIISLLTGSDRNG